MKTGKLRQPNKNKQRDDGKENEKTIKVFRSNVKIINGNQRLCVNI